MKKILAVLALLPLLVLASLLVAIFFYAMTSFSNDVEVVGWQWSVVFDIAAWVGGGAVVILAGLKLGSWALGELS